MKRILLSVLGVLVAGAILWLLFRPPSPGGESAESVATEVSVHVATITRSDLHAYITAYGSVEGAPPGHGGAGGASQIAAQVDGVLTAVLVAEGDRVDEGAPLFQLDSRVADAEADRAADALRFAEATVRRQRRLLPAGGASERSLQEAEQALAARRGDLEAARVQQQLRKIRAPFRGTLVHILVRPGEAVQVGTALAEMEDIDHLVARVGVPAAELDRVRRGASVELTSEGRQLGRGQVEYVSPQVDPSSGLAGVRVSLPGGGTLHRGQFVRARIVVEVQEGHLTVPVAAVVRADDGCEIAVVEGGMARRRPVTCGIREDDRVGIEGEGLSEGMTVVAAGVYGLPDESRIKVIGS